MREEEDENGEKKNKTKRVKLVEVNKGPKGAHVAVVGGHSDGNCNMSTDEISSQL